MTGVAFNPLPSGFGLQEPYSLAEPRSWWKQEAQSRGGLRKPQDVDQIDRQDKPKAACQLTSAQVCPSPPGNHACGSDPQPVCPNTPGPAGTRDPGTLSGRSRVDAASPWFPGTALRGPAGPSHHPGFTVYLPFKSSGGEQGLPRNQKEGKVTPISHGDPSCLGPASETLGQGGHYFLGRGVIWPFSPHPALPGTLGSWWPHTQARAVIQGPSPPSQSQHFSEDDQDSSSVQRGRAAGCPVPRDHLPLPLPIPEACRLPAVMLRRTRSD